MEPYLHWRYLHFGFLKSQIGTGAKFFRTLQINLYQKHLNFVFSKNPEKRQKRQEIRQVTEEDTDANELLLLTVSQFFDK